MNTDPDITANQLVDLVLQAHSDGDAAHWTVRGLLDELRNRRSNADPYYARCDRSTLNSMIHWLSLCQCVKGATPTQWTELLTEAHRQCNQLDLGQEFTAAGIQNWYLDPKVGQVDSLRQSVMDQIPPRSVGCSGARHQSLSSCQRDRGTGPRSSPLTGGLSE